MKIPNSEYAVVSIEKLIDYCLNMDHPRGCHKARVFATALGITKNEAEQLRTAMLDACRNYEAILSKKDEYGQRYILDFPMKGTEGLVWIRSLWIICKHEIVSRLTSCFVLR